MSTRQVELPRQEAGPQRWAFAAGLLVVGLVGYRFTRTNQMVSQYHWLYERTSALGWKAKG